MLAPRTTQRLPDVFQESEHLPTLPSAAIEVLRLTRDPDAGISDLARTISLDPALTAKLLTLANSARYCRGTSTTSLDRACVILGMKTVQLMALSFSLVQGLPSKGKDTAFDYELYWRHSISTGVAARSILRMFKSSLQEEAFLCGLLVRIGQMLMAHVQPLQYAKVLDSVDSELVEAEDEFRCLGYDHHMVAAEVLGNWKIPDLIVNTISSWEYDLSPHLRPDIIDLCKAVRFGDAISKLFSQGNKGIALQQVQDIGAELYGLADVEVHSLIVSLEREIQDMAEALDVGLGNRKDHASILEEARQQMVHISLEAMLDKSDAEDRARRLEEHNEKLQLAATTDPLTGLANRASLDENLKRIFNARLGHSGESAIGLLMVDIDYFKDFNDAHGHKLGDQMLKHVANCLKRSTRSTDLLARYGGEEFTVIVSNIALSDLKILSERIRHCVESNALEYRGRSFCVTISIGGAIIKNVASVEDEDRLVNEADQNLYKAKAGRNRSICSTLEE